MNFSWYVGIIDVPIVNGSGLVGGVGLVLLHHDGGCTG